MSPELCFHTLRGQINTHQLQAEGLSPRFQQLDIDDLQSIRALRDFLRKEYGGLDVLVNNAGIALKGNDPTPFHIQAEVTMKTNFFGTRDVCSELLPLMKPQGNDPTPFHIQAEVTMKTNFFGTRDVCSELLPLMKPQGRVVNVSSMESLRALKNCSPELQQKFRSDTISEEELVGLMNKFVEDARNGVHQREGWPNRTYGVTKIGVTVLSRIHARNLSAHRRGDKILLLNCCPGWVRTDLTGPQAPKSPEEGRVVNVSSMESLRALKNCSPELQQKFRSDTISEEELVGLMNKFVEDARNGVHQREGWPNRTYGVTKIGVTVLSRIHARNLSAHRRGDKILLNACCPGWVRTDLTGPQAPKSPEEGAETPVFLALLPSDAEGPPGQLVTEKKVVKCSRVQSIRALRDFLRKEYGGLDVLVNNAGIAFKVNDPTPFHIQAEVTMKTNFFGTRDVCTELLPLMKPQGRVVNVSSMVSLRALKNCSPELQQKFRSDTISEEELVGLMNKFVEDTRNGVHQKEGWPNTAYGVTKIGVTVLSRIHARNLSAHRRGDKILLNACCPGWVRTDLTGPQAPKSPEEGAETPVFLALLPSDAEGPHGQFVMEKKVEPW
ncbi:Carbonyl reductase [NADPH] 1 [Myotis brandtii]|uniref:Carbonyl reductase [NADPH] 1 n=1 Tax=Myotis brandtii TaxID=109478 RepID=S7P3A1_MYOBR|nr:Carbonyl reductase [NADPH] 1 [Myotis brandtii]